MNVTVSLESVKELLLSKDISRNVKKRIREVCPEYQRVCLFFSNEYTAALSKGEELPVLDPLTVPLVVTPYAFDIAKGIEEAYWEMRRLGLRLEM